MAESRTTKTMPASTTDHDGAGSLPGDISVPSRSRLRPLLIAVLVVVVVIAGWLGVDYLRYAAAHATTDDAYVTSDLVQIAPQITGTVKRVLVEDNQLVHTGQLLVVFDDAPFRAAVDQAKANLDVAIAQAQGAGVSVSLTRETGGAQLTQAQAGVAQATSGIASAIADAARSDAALADAKASAGTAHANVANAQAALTAAISNRDRAGDSVNSAIAAVDTARAAVRAAQAAVDAAQSVADRAARDAVRYTSLAKQGAVGEQTADSYATAAQTARAQLEATRQQQAQAEATVAQRVADLNAARQQQTSLGAAVTQAQAQLAAARDQEAAARAGIGQAVAVRSAALESVQAARARREQARGMLAEAQTTPRQVAISTSAQAQANAKIEQARAALEAAKVNLGYTRITAPESGRISAKSVEVGETVQLTTPLLAIVPDDVWVVANYKETQLTHVRAGQRAEVEADALPGHVFYGHVDSVAAGTGSTFALLPPDNATGNFTKVVQRVPVKIVIDPGDPLARRLRAGLSVTASIETR